MKEYPKIQTLYKRDPKTGFKTVLTDQYSKPEFELLKDSLWEFTEKIDGTNIRINIDNKGGVTFHGRTNKSQIPVELVNNLIAIFGDNHLLLSEIFPKGACLYGEGCGNSIQPNGDNYGECQNFVLFDVLIDDIWLSRENINDIAIRFDIKSVPIIETAPLTHVEKLFSPENVEKLLISTFGDFMAEGIVARPKIELKNRLGERIITKLKCSDIPKHLIPEIFKKFPKFMGSSYKTNPWKY